LDAERCKQQKQAAQAIGRLIKSAREERDLSQEQLADMVGVSSPYISQLELGKRLPTDALTIKIAKAVNYDARDLAIRVLTARSPETIELLGEDSSGRGDEHEDIYTSLRNDPLFKQLWEHMAILHKVLPEEQFRRRLEAILALMEPQEKSKTRVRR